MNCISLFFKRRCPWGIPFISIVLSSAPLAGAQDITSMQNLALGKPSSIRHAHDGIPPASNANDGDLNTEAYTSEMTTDGYWEVDLGTAYAVYGVGSIPKSGLESNIGYTTVRLFDENHNSVYSARSNPNGSQYLNDFGKPYAVRYIRVGLEDKIRTSTTTRQWYIGFKEIRVFGEPLSNVGLRAFNVSSSSIQQGQSVTLSWDVQEMDHIELYPNVGSVAADTGTDGLGSRQINPSQSTEYTLIAWGGNITNVLKQTVTVNNHAPSLFISEFVADNRYSLDDGYGDASDWIEIQNPSSAPINLAGYGLSDNPANPMKWVFPTISIPANSNLIVFASGRTEPVDPVSGIHASFKLGNAGGESILLSAPNGTLIDSILNYPAQKRDLSYGRSLDGTLCFLEPTPHKANQAPTYLGWLERADYSHTRGFYTTPFSLTLTNLNAGAMLLYSMDGSEPHIPYTGALSINGTETVRTQVTRAGFKSPQSKTHTFIFQDDVINSTPWMDTSLISQYPTRVRNGLMDNPSLSIVIPTALTYSEEAGSIEILWPDNSNPVQENCGIKRFGGAWTEFDKKNIRVKFRSAYGKSKLEAPLFKGFDHGILAKSKFDVLDLLAGSHDIEDPGSWGSARGFYMSGRFAEDSMLDMGNLNPHGRFVNVYLNGVYWGQYSLRENMDDAFCADYLGGDKSDYTEVRGNDNEGSVFSIGIATPPSPGTWEYVRENRSSFSAIAPYMDMHSYIDFMLLFSLGMCETEFRAVGPAAPGKGFQFWIADADGFLPSSWWKGIFAKNGNFLDGLADMGGPGYIFEALVAEGHPDFRALLADRIYTHFYNNGALTQAACETRLDERMTEIQDSIIAEFARWGTKTPSLWLSEADYAKQIIFVERLSDLLDELKIAGFYPAFEPPVLNQLGGAVDTDFEVTLSSPVGTIYYTLDGSDPRWLGGTVSGNALVYSATLSEETLIPAGASWRYLDNGSNPGSLWTLPNFDDTSWLAGNAELGYGDGGEATEISYGPQSDNKYITTYFRHPFVVNDPSTVSELKLRLLRDDGVVVYLNGTEVVRDNMPAGTITSSTLASSAAGGTDETAFYGFSILPTALLTGTNILTVELHQSSQTSSDASFDLELKSIHSVSSNPIILTNGTALSTRALYNGQWSALSQTSFQIGERPPVSSANVAISEIHFHPRESSDFEFIEIMNTGTNLLDLSGVSIEDAVRYIFPDSTLLAPGAVLVVVEDLAAFSNRYQNAASPYFRPGIQVAGKWVGGLSNSGESISLYNSNGEELCTVAYQSGGDWPRRADGEGSSLVLRNPNGLPTSQPALNAHLSHGFNWTASSSYAGTPGRIDPFESPVVINEILSHTDLGVDWIELYNSGDTPFDLSNYALTDTIDLPARYVFPAGSTVPTNGYLSISATDLGFGFSELGGQAFLQEISGNTIIRFLDSVDFPAAAREESFGRHLRSDGIAVFTEQLVSMPNASNAPPRVGPVVISEIMYMPNTGQSAYVELYNLSETATPLYDPAIPTNTWILSGIGNFSFPTGVVMDPYEILIICATNPAAFRTQSGIDPVVPVYGPWAGNLDPDGELLELLSPGDPEPDGFIPRYRADYVAYRTNGTWATANTGNISLERYPMDAYGNDPAGWKGSAANGSPGSLAEYYLPFESVISISSSQASVIGFPAIRGQSYEVRYTESLPEPDWKLLASVSSASTNWIEVPGLISTNQVRYYQIFWIKN